MLVRKHECKVMRNQLSCSNVGRSSSLHVEDAIFSPEPDRGLLELAVIRAEGTLRLRSRCMGEIEGSFSTSCGEGIASVRSSKPVMRMMAAWASFGMLRGKLLCATGRNPPRSCSLVFGLAGGLDLGDSRTSSVVECPSVTTSDVAGVGEISMYFLLLLRWR